MPASLRRFWIQITSDRKRFGVLCATIGVGLLLWARLIIVSQVPRTAMAEQGGSAASNMSSAGKSSKSAGGAGGSGSAGSAADKPDSKGAGKAVAVRQRVVDVRLWSLSERDPFVISPLHFPKATAALDVKQEAGKLPTEPAEDALQKEARLAARLNQLLGSLKLEAALGNSMAVIEGKRYRVGDVLPAVGSERVQFTLTEVRQRSVVLEWQGRRLELQMSLPGQVGGESSS